MSTGPITHYGHSAEEVFWRVLTNLEIPSYLVPSYDQAHAAMDRDRFL